MWISIRHPNNDIARKVSRPRWHHIVDQDLKLEGRNKDDSHSRLRIGHLAAGTAWVDNRAQETRHATVTYNVWNIPGQIYSNSLLDLHVCPHTPV
jgi:hypothetical protein